jgi:hypothetical protein
MSNSSSDEADTDIFDESREVLIVHRLNYMSYLRVATSQVRRSSSIKASTTRVSGEESFSRPQHWR